MQFLSDRTVVFKADSENMAVKTGFFCWFFLTFHDRGQALPFTNLSHYSTAESPQSMGFGPYSTSTYGIPCNTEAGNGRHFFQLLYKINIYFSV